MYCRAASRWWQACIHVQSLHSVLCQLHRLLQILPTAKPCSVSATSFPFVVLPLEKPYFQVGSPSLHKTFAASSLPCLVSAGTISLPLWPSLLSSLETPLSRQGTSRLHICLEDHPVCVRLKLTLKLIQFFLPITHPPPLPQLRLICHINPFKLGKIQVQFLLLRSIPPSYFTLSVCKTIPVPSNIEVTVSFSPGAWQMLYECCYIKINCIAQYSTLLICKNDVTHCKFTISLAEKGSKEGSRIHRRQTPPKIEMFHLTGWSISMTLRRSSFKLMNSTVIKPAASMSVTTNWKEKQN